MKKAKSLSIKVELTILKPAAEVFKAILNPVPYFAESVSEPLTTGRTVKLKFSEMRVPIALKVKEVEPFRRIRFEWGSAQGGHNLCEMVLSKPQDLNPAAQTKSDATTLSITESGWPDNEKGRASANGNTMGWTHMACSLKAYLEYGVNLRAGSFLHMKF